MYYIRFTHTIQEDIKRNTSILTNHENMIVNGLCVFPGRETIQETRVKADSLRTILCTNEPYFILTGKYYGGKETGTLGTVITDVKLIESEL